MKLRLKRCDFGITKINLLSNNPAKKGLEENGIEVEKMVSVITDFNKHNIKYIQIKKEKIIINLMNFLIIFYHLKFI